MLAKVCYICSLMLILFLAKWVFYYKYDYLFLLGGSRWSTKRYQFRWEKLHIRSCYAICDEQYCKMLLLYFRVWQIFGRASGCWRAITGQTRKWGGERSAEAGAPAATGWLWERSLCLVITVFSFTSLLHIRIVLHVLYSCFKWSDLPSMQWIFYHQLSV